MNDVKQWGGREFWGVGFEFDPQWFLTEEDKALQSQLVELCRSTLRPNAVSKHFPVFMCPGMKYS